MIDYQQFPPQQIYPNQMQVNSQFNQPFSFPINPINNFQNQMRSQPLQPQPQLIQPQYPMSASYQQQNLNQFQPQLPPQQNIQQLVPQTLYINNNEQSRINANQPAAQYSLVPASTIDSSKQQSSVEMNIQHEQNSEKRQNNQNKTTIKKPLTNLNGLKYPQKFFCEDCQEETTSKLTYQISSGTKLMACILIPVCTCFIPFCKKDCKDKTHNCPICGKVVGQAQYKPC